MASVPKALKSHLARSARKCPCLRVGLLLVLTSGCAHLGKNHTDDPMPHGTVCQVVTTWNHQVVNAPDPVHAGAPTPGLVGRLYLFGQEISYPLIEEGSVIVDLYDDSKQNSSVSRPPLEEWRLDPATLKRLAKRDTIGWGYTVFLPWATYKPDIKMVHLKVRFEPAKGTPLYAESGPLTLDNSSNSVTGLARQQVKPTGLERIGSAN